MRKKIVATWLVVFLFMLNFAGQGKSNRNNGARQRQPGMKSSSTVPVCLLFRDLYDRKDERLRRYCAGMVAWSSGSRTKSTPLGSARS